MSMTINDHITAVLKLIREGEGDDVSLMTTKFVLVAEGMDENGERGIYTATHEGARAWDTIGLLQFGLMNEQAALTAHHGCE